MKNNEITLIANSGIQFVTKNVFIPEEDEKFQSQKKEFAELSNDSGSTYELVLPYYRNDTGEYIIKELINEEAFDELGRVQEEKIHTKCSYDIKENFVYKVSFLDALSLFEERWIPIPCLRVTNNTSIREFDNGPTTWARMYIARHPLGREEDGTSHSITFAFDTQIEKTDKNSGRVEVNEILSSRDVNEVGQNLYSCPSDNESLISFLSGSVWVQDWVSDLYNVGTKNSRLARTTQGFKSVYAGVYIALFGMLEYIDTIPEVSVYKSSERNIEVSLVLDIGNSRTCGLLLETTTIGQAFDFQNAKRLSIRNLSTPNHTADEPFEMRIALVEEKFGDDGYTSNMLSSTKKVFEWPSWVRVGSEASKYIALNGKKKDQLFYMSSPKRYLWDKRESIYPWRSIQLNLDGQIEFDTSHFGVAQHFTVDGKLIVKKPKGVDRVKQINGKYDLDYTGDGDRILKEDVRNGIPNPTIPPYMGSGEEPKYSKSSLMTLTIFELVLQALSQVNSYDYRSGQPNSNVGRRIKSLVLTCPTAMTQLDQKSLRNAADDAIDLLKLYFDESFIDSDLEIIPTPINTKKQAENPQHWMYDEATCSQLAFLYGDIRYRFNNDVDLYFKHCGKKIEGLPYTDGESITVASIDIGGGTTDVMICSYTRDPKTKDGALIEPHPLFWEGFNLAGDDILRRLIERIIIPQIEKYAKTKEVNRLNGKLSDLFGPNTGSLEYPQKVFKNLIVNQITLPIAYGFLEYMTLNQSPKSLKFDDFFQNRPRPSQEIVKDLNTKFGDEFNIEEIVWEIAPDAIGEVIFDLVGDMLTHICSIVSQFECDVLLLAGRPTKIPVIKEIILKKLPVTPDRVITLGDYRIGNWYPFSDSHHRIKDPKTIVVVGAAISHMSESGKLDKFKFKTSTLKKIGTTANYIGKYDANSAKIKPNVVYFDGASQLEATFKFNGGGLIIGKRQLSDENWRAAPMYQIRYKNEDSAKKLMQYGFDAPFEITVERDEFNIEILYTDREVTDAKGDTFRFDEYFELASQSLGDEYGYWMDTGCFTLNIIEE